MTNEIKLPGGRFRLCSQGCDLLIEGLRIQGHKDLADRHILAFAHVHFADYTALLMLDGLGFVFDDDIAAE